MRVTQTDISDVRIIEPDVFTDERGFFMETWQKRKFAEIGVDCDFVQDNHSRSVQHTLRGIHYQIRQTQGKLARVTIGEVFDVAVDLRKSSPTFGKWVSVYLSAENRRIVWIPPGFGHGFYVTSDIAEFQYKCSDYYAPAAERCIHWDDPQLSIAWPLSGRPLLSDRDRLDARPLAESEWFE